jgi:hypothetical protein
MRITYAQYCQMYARMIASPAERNIGVGDEGVKGFIPPDEEPGVVDKFEG